MKKRSIESYILEKGIYSIIFNLMGKDSENYEEIILNPDFYSMLKHIIEHHVKNGDFSSTVRMNILNFLSYLRFEFREKHEINKENWDTINEIILMLNSQKEDNSPEFYLNLFYTRFKLIRYKLLKKYYLERFTPEAEQVAMELLSIDLDIFYSHSSDCSYQIFCLYYLDLFVDNDDYIYALNGVLTNFPELLQDETFRRRALKILRENNKLPGRYTINGVLTNFPELLQDETFRRRALKILRENNKLLGRYIIRKKSNILARKIKKISKRK